MDFVVFFGSNGDISPGLRFFTPLENRPLIKRPKVLLWRLLLAQEPTIWAALRKSDWHLMAPCQFPPLFNMFRLHCGCDHQPRRVKLKPCTAQTNLCASFRAVL